MTLPPQELEQLLVWVVTATLCVARCLSAMTVFPLFAHELVPATPRMAMALAFTLLLMPQAYEQVQAAPMLALSGQTVMLLLKEVFIGVVIGFSFGLLFWAIENVGHLIDFQSGLTFTQLVDPLVGQQVSVHARLLVRVFGMYFLAVGGLQLFLQALYASYALWPLMKFGIEIKGPWLTLFVDQSAMLISLSLLFAAPVVMVLILVELAFGLFNRAAPNFDVFDVTRPIKGWLATGILLLTLPYILERSLQAIGAYKHLLKLLDRVMQ